MATTRWIYRDGEGRSLFAVARFDLVDASGVRRKEVLPLCWCRPAKANGGGNGSWRFKAPAAPRSLYGLDRLAAHPEAPVLVVEGEKAADAAATLFPDHVAITSQGGCKAADKANWTPLLGRRAVIWADNAIGLARTMRRRWPNWRPPQARLQRG
jgi:hypothetical protein